LDTKPDVLPLSTGTSNDRQQASSPLTLISRWTALCLIFSFGALQGCLSKSLTSLQILPAANSETVSLNQTAQFHAIGIFTAPNHANKTEDVTNQTSWSSSNPAVATISSTGLATGVSAGSATITGSANGHFGIVTGTSNITVSSAPATHSLTSLAIIPGTQIVGAIGETAQYIAIGTYNVTPLTQDLTSQVKWVSSDVKIAQVSTAGLVTAVGSGTATITALASDPNAGVISASASIQVNTQSGAVNLPTLTIYKVGNGSGTVTGTGTITPTVVIECGSGAQCIGNFPLGSTVELIANPNPGSVFDGWSANCTPTAPKANSCILTMNNNDAVGAVFDLTTP
jgi:hypothetical protein